MNELNLLSNNMIGSENALSHLSSLDHARILVCSDSHGNFDILSRIILQYGKSCNAFCFCGDGLSDIAHLYDKALGDEELSSSIPPIISYVQGNCDPSSYPLLDGKELIAPPSQILNVNNQGIMMVHGNREGITYGFEKYGLKIKYAENTFPVNTALFGHTHIAEEGIENNIKFINPGSCVSPRGGQNKSFAILTVEKTFIDVAFLEINGIKDKELDCKLWTPN